MLRLKLLKAVVIAGVLFQASAFASKCSQALRYFLKAKPDANLSSISKPALKVIDLGIIEKKSFKKSFMGSFDRHNARLFKKVYAGEKWSYVVDSKGQMHFVQGEVDFTKLDNELLVAGFKTETGEDHQLLIKEAGELSYDHEHKKYLYNAKYSPDDLADEEFQGAIKSIRTLDDEVLTQYERRGVNASRVYRCADVFTAKKGGKGFIKDQFIAYNILNTVTLLQKDPEAFANFIEMSSQKVTGNFDSKEQEHYTKMREKLTMDYATNNAYILFKTYVGNKIVFSNAGIVKSYAGRLASQELYSGVQYGICLATRKDKDNKPDYKTCNKMLVFHMAYNVYQAASMNLIDTFIVKRVNDWAFEECMSNPNMAIMVSTKAVRIYLGYASTLLYYQTRKATIDE